jgi:5-methylcytosine-specific restriction protein A
VHSLAQASRSGALAARAAPDVGNAADPAAAEPDESVVPEGRVLYRLHRQRERQPALRARKLAGIAQTGEPARCEACGLAPQALYGERGMSVLECHHLDPLSLGERQTRLSDVALVCANCHPALHGLGLLLSPAELRQTMPADVVGALSA